MKKSILALIALSSFSTIAAANCPDLTGEYSCKHYNLRTGGWESHADYQETILKTNENIRTEIIPQGARLISTVQYSWKNNVHSTPSTKEVTYDGETIHSHYYGEPVAYTYSCDENGYYQDAGGGDISDSRVEIIKTANGYKVLKGDSKRSLKLATECLQVE